MCFSFHAKRYDHEKLSLFSRGMTILILVVVILASTASAAAAPQETEKKKNVLILMSDEHSGRLMGCVGHPLVKTPTFDALADSGVVFRNAYCQNPVCVPSRASLVTGQVPSKLGAFVNTFHKVDGLRDTPVTLARSFAEAGYSATWLGKEHWGTSNSNLGFDKENDRVFKDIHLKRVKEYTLLKRKVGNQPMQAQPFGDEIKPILDAVVTMEARRWLDKYDGSKPFLLGLSLVNPHFPFIVLEQYYNMYKDVIDLPRVTPEMIENLPLAQKLEREDYGWGNMTDDQIKIARAVYFGQITYADTLFAWMLDKLEQKGLRNDTIIVYLSDHGELAGERGVWYKNAFYEDSAKVPLILSYPGEIEANTTVWSPVQLMDIFPTLCDLCNIPIPKEVDGKSLMPIIRGDEDGWKRHAISENYRHSHGGARMVRKGQWKYCWYAESKNELFDLRNDPAELNNLYDDPQHASLIEHLHELAMEGYLTKPYRKWN